ncbi:hypothetical protein CKQ84_08395 [Shewanella sp. WE21]|uniref:pyridoxal phosphate-dependent aminotransferase n=1 Tax=Shewanella sp. WE21 TaxID=2029986 RepID=UPI000CF741FD|nr:histidinol-phosphate transaminase [Shewanella sp. WE21]AVI65888.1 hypothetical protein CKQ84_08395 [Shewanella sp. WE21]
MTIYNKGIPDGDLLIRAHLNENQFGMTPAVWDNFDQQRANLYPDPQCLDIQKQIADFYGVSTDMVHVTNGTDEVILMISMAFLSQQVPAIVSDYSFPGYETSARICGANVHYAPLDGYEVPIAQMGTMSQEQQSVIFVCNPHNPTGTMVSQEGIANLVSQASHTDSLAVFDEAYAEFAGDDFCSAIGLIKQGKRVMVTRTLSKAYGLGGFRIGYVIGLPEDIAKITKVHAALPFAVNRLAQNAAKVALSDQTFLRHSVERTSAAKTAFYQAMDAAGIGYIHSHTNFILLNISNKAPMLSSAEFVEKLQDEFGVLVRDAGLFKLYGHIRVSMVDEPHQQALCNAIVSTYKKLREQ